MLIHEYDGSDLTDAVDLKDETAGFSAAAVLGTAEIVDVVVQDPAGALAFVGHKTWTIRETDCATGNQVAWVGFVGRKVQRRGKYRTGAARVWEVQLVEANTFLLRKLLRSVQTTTARDGETVSDRVAWVLTTVGLAGFVADHGLVESSGVTMDPYDYDGMTAADVLRDCALASGFNFAIRYREASDDFEMLFRDEDTSVRDQSALRVSNDLADVDDATTWASNIDVAIEQIPDRVAPGILLPFSGGESVYGFDAAVAAAFADIDLVAPTPTVSTGTTADDLLAHLLAQHSTEEEKVTGLWIDVPAANLNDVKQGQLIQAKFTHGQGWQSFRSARVTRKVFGRPENLTQRRYRVGLELEPADAIEYVTTDARLMRPNATNDPGSGGGTFKMDWDHDGDHTQAGDTAYPLVGLIAYLGSVGERTGLQVSGSGIVTCTLAFSILTVASVTHTFTAYIKVNGVTVATVANTKTGGLFDHGWAIGGPTSLLAVNVPVISGDIIEAWVTSSPSVDVNTIPLGIGSGSDWLRVAGLLA